MCWSRCAWIVLFIHRVHSLHYVYDETLWTKSQWDSLKLDNPLREFNPSSEGLKPASLEQLLSEHKYNSIDGVLPRRSKSVITDILATEQPVPEAFNDPKMLEQASKAVQCATCHALMTTTWERLTSLVNTGKDVTEKVIRTQFLEACTQEVADEVLTSSTIYKLQAEAGGATLAFFVVRPRRKGTPRTPLEGSAVLSACQTLVSERLDSLVDTLSALLKMYGDQLQVILEGAQEGVGAGEGGSADGGGAAASGGPGVDGHPTRASLPQGDEDVEGGPASADAEEAAGGGGGRTGKGSAALKEDDEEYYDYDEYGDEEDGGRKGAAFAGDGECRDLHPDCEMWAGLGECELNPLYMVGDADHPGHCLLSCGVCTPRDPQRTRLPPAIISNSMARKELTAVSSTMLESLKASSCVAARACMGAASTTSFSGGVFRANEEEPSEAAGAEVGEDAALKAGGRGKGRKHGKGGKPTGPGSDREDEEEAEVEPVGFVLGRAFSGVANYRGLEAAEKAALAPYPLPDPDAPELLSRVHHLLLKELGNKVLYRPGPPDEYFTYEVVWKQRVQHWHAEPDGTLTESWSLGLFSGESVDAEVVEGRIGKRVLERKDFLARKKMDGRVWPYIEQKYTGGDRCQQGREEMRQTEVRLACSPDGEMHMLVREPAFCSYVVVLYVPSLCNMPELLPQAAGGSKS